MEKQLDPILRFMELLHKFRKVERMVYSNGTDRKENDIEHSYNLAMLSWYINNTLKLNLDLEKVFIYSLVHDLVEVYAGDTYFLADEKILDLKQEKEKLAAETLREEFPEFEELHLAITDYESKSDPESKFVYALDKVEPLLSIYLDKGETWKRNYVELSKLNVDKGAKVALDKNIEKIYNELFDRFRKEEEDLFSTRGVKL